ncbi:organic cation/carnitine transporter 3 [Prunus dulcis]|uniref:Organic cation/carnitine transporter 3 n=1 Tax=Prunus dulcis TaxID=3755 RepID=A0A5H2XWH3_PRUDU|nr:organic cation/carnitine transporter 3 [Prunus dulcis]
MSYLPGFGIHYEYHKVKVEVPRGVGYPACGQTPYVALVVPAYGEICDIVLRSHVALSGVETDPIRGVGCTGVWGDM